MKIRFFFLALLFSACQHGSTQTVKLIHSGAQKNVLQVGNFTVSEKLQLQKWKGRNLAQDVTRIGEPESRVSEPESAGVVTFQPWEVSMASNLYIPEGSTLSRDEGNPPSPCLAETHNRDLYSIEIRASSVGIASYRGSLLMGYGHSNYPLERMENIRRTASFSTPWERQFGDWSYDPETGHLVSMHEARGARGEGYYEKHFIAIDPELQVVTEAYMEIRRGAPNQAFENMALQARFTCNPAMS